MRNFLGHPPIRIYNPDSIQLPGLAWETVIASSRQSVNPVPDDGIPFHHLLLTLRAISLPKTSFSLTKKDTERPPINCTSPITIWCVFYSPTQRLLTSKIVVDSFCKPIDSTQHADPGLINCQPIPTSESGFTPKSQLPNTSCFSSTFMEP